MGVRAMGMLRRRAERRRALMCRNAVELMTDYLEGALSPPDTAAFEGHLARCAACMRYLDQMRATVTALGQLDPGRLPEAVVDELVWLYRRHRAG
jgi:anti-sigma factor RsiW